MCHKEEKTHQPNYEKKTATYCKPVLKALLTFLFQDDRNDIWVVVSYGHVERRLQSHAVGFLRQGLLGLQVGVGALLEQFGGQAGQAAATRRMKRALALLAGTHSYICRHVMIH